MEIVGWWIIIIQDSPLFHSWICMLNYWVSSCFPWRAGLWDLFRCLELSLESGDWGNDLWASPVEIDIFSTKINVNKISEWEKTYSNLWCFTGIIVFHFKKLPLIISGIFGPGGRQSWKLNTHPVPEQESSHMWSEFWTGKNLLVWEGPRVAWIRFFYLNFSLGHPTWGTSQAFGWWFRAGICCIIGSIICGNDIPTARWIITYHHYMNQMPGWCRWLWMQIADQLM